MVKYIIQVQLLTIVILTDHQKHPQLVRSSNKIDCNEFKRSHRQLSQ